MKNFVVVLFCGYVTAEIRDSVIMNKLIKVKPVGGVLRQKFLPLTEIPPPHTPHVHSGRRHLEDCTEKDRGRDVIEGGGVVIAGEDYYDYVAKTVATVIIPDHIDRKHFEVTTQVPYLTLGPIEAIGYHPTTKTPNECEQIYQDHLDEQYSEEDTDFSEESLEMARMPLFPGNMPTYSAEARLENMYSDVDINN